MELAGAKIALVDSYNQLPDIGKVPQTLFDKLYSKARTLQKSTELLRDNLSIGSMLSSMVSKEALSQEDANNIKMIKSETDQVDKLIDILRRKPMMSYLIFMELLEIERKDLYQVVRENEKEENQVAFKRTWRNDDQEPVKSKRLCHHTSLELTNNDIDYLVNDLSAKQLCRLFNKLGITKEDRSNAIEDSIDPKEEAKYVLRYWLQQHENTRELIQVALNDCSLKETARNLMRIWGDDYKGHEVGSHQPIVKR